MSRANGTRRLITRVGEMLCNLAEPGYVSGPGAAVVVYKLQARWPNLPGPTRSGSQSPDSSPSPGRQGTLCVPASLGLDASAAVEDDCPMAHSVEDEGTHITLGERDMSLGLLFTDQALLNMTRLSQQASREMLRRRKQPAPDWLGYELK